MAAHGSYIGLWGGWRRYRRLWARGWLRLLAVGQGEPGQVEPGQVEPGQVEPGQDRTGRGESGQGSVEFAIVCLAFMGVVVGLAALWHALSGGMFVDHALASASHHLQSVTAGAIGDVFLY